MQRKRDYMQIFGYLDESQDFLEKALEFSFFGHD